MVRARILVIDDDPAIRDSLQVMLGTAGYDVWATGSGTAGLEKHLVSPFDLVVTDIVMPDLDGLEIIRTLKSATAGVPVVAMSGGGSFGGALYLDLASRLGADLVLDKPVAAQTLLQAIAVLLGLTEAQRQPRLTGFA